MCGRCAAPALFAVTQLRGAADSGPFRMAPVAPAAATARPKAARPSSSTPKIETVGKQWIVLTGLVPVLKQEAAYVETFRDAVFSDPARDVPSYLAYWVERVEVNSPGEAANPPWDDKDKVRRFFSRDESDKAKKEWGEVTSPDVVTPDFIDPQLTFPLGPLVGRTWSANVTHPPEIAIPKGQAEAAEMAGSPETRPVDRGQNRGGAAATPFDDNPFGPETKPPSEAVRGAPVEVPGAAPGAMVPGAMPPGAMAPGAMAPGVMAQEQKPYKLFRFFDFNVEPGKQYVYRVRLALRNPNRYLKPALLKSPELADKKFLETPWSEPSPAIGVSLGWRISLVGVTRAARVGSEPVAQVSVTMWRQKDGEEFTKEFTVARGQVLNFLGESVASTLNTAIMPGPTPETGGGEVGAPEPPRAESDDSRAAGAGGPPGTSTTTHTRRVNVDFVTDAVAIDIRGGDRICAERTARTAS